ncbi:MAG TPA: hypothetical protein VNO23_07530 [Candidatus Binatia bacterium]|nr:hypothetical protein [Candidatus Binatia bacterium]
MEALFSIEPVPPAPPPERESHDVRRTKRQKALLAAGKHPLSAVLSRSLRLHAEAAPHDDRRAEGRRCDSCAFLAKNGWGYLKCTFGDGLRASHSEASDVRRWWPACVDHQFKESN